jgi:hypothetical protein
MAEVYVERTIIAVNNRLALNNASIKRIFPA